MALRNNLFFINAVLFDKSEVDCGAGVIPGKFGTNPKYPILGLDTVRDDFGYTLNGNVALDPKMPVVMPVLKGIDSGAVKRQNTIVNDVRRIFGRNQDGGTVEIANFAPQLVYDVKALPLPTEESARKYGGQVNDLWSLDKK